MSLYLCNTNSMQKITPFLWYKNDIREAIDFYTSVFKKIEVKGTTKGPNDTLLGATLEIEGQQLFLLNGGPTFSFTPAISLYIFFETQEEVDYYWEKLADGGRPDRCGWLQDRFGLSWQVVPDVLPKMLGDSDPLKVK